MRIDMCVEEKLVSN